MSLVRSAGAILCVSILSLILTLKIHPDPATFCLRVLSAILCQNPMGHFVFWTTASLESSSASAGAGAVSSASQHLLSISCVFSVSVIRMRIFRPESFAGGFETVLFDICQAIEERNDHSADE